jgi:hypothetical protein
MHMQVDEADLSKNTRHGVSTREQAFIIARHPAETSAGKRRACGNLWLSERPQDHRPDGDHASEGDQRGDLSSGFYDQAKHWILRVPMMFIIVREMFHVKAKGLPARCMG